MDRIDLEELKNEIITILYNTFDQIVILNYMPEIAYADEPFFLIKGIYGDELFLLKYKLVDLLRWKDEGILREILIRNRYEVNPL